MHFSLHFLESEKHFPFPCSVNTKYHYFSLDLLLGTFISPVAHSELTVQGKKNKPNENKTLFPMLRATFIASPSCRITVLLGFTASGSDPRAPMKVHPESRLQKSTSDPVVKYTCLGGKMLNGDRSCCKANTTLICRE